MDCDIISHFIATGEIIYLSKILSPLEIVLLENVYIEATKIKKRKMEVDNSIDFLGTLDLLLLAIEKGIFDKTRCDEFIAKAKSINNARFPVGVNQISDYIPRNIDFMK